MFAAPRTPTEQVLADIWGDLLGLEQVGIYDQFFRLGGHSLLAAQVISRILGVFQIEIPLRVLMETPTIAGLAEALVSYESIPGQVAVTARLHQQIKDMQPGELRAMLQARRKPQEGK